MTRAAICLIFAYGVLSLILDGWFHASLYLIRLQDWRSARADRRTAETRAEAEAEAAEALARYKRIYRHEPRS